MQSISLSFSDVYDGRAKGFKKSTVGKGHRYLRKVDCWRHISWQKIYFNKCSWHIDKNKAGEPGQWAVYQYKAGRQVQWAHFKCQYFGCSLLYNKTGRNVTLISLFDDISMVKYDLTVHYSIAFVCLNVTTWPFKMQWTLFLNSGLLSDTNSGFETSKTHSNVGRVNAP